MHSNTTLVKVKSTSNIGILLANNIQIQHLLKLNSFLIWYIYGAIFIQIQHLLKLNMDLFFTQMEECL